MQNLNKLIILFIILSSSCLVGCEEEQNIQPTGHINPPHNSAINRTVVLLEYESVPAADEYLIEIAKANCQKIEECKVKTQRSNTITTIIKDSLEFGYAYKWQVKAYKNGKLMNTSKIHEFSIRKVPKVDSTKYRHIIKQKKEGVLKGGYVLLDELGVAINEDGLPVWYVEAPNGRNGLACLDLLPNGNTLFINGSFMESSINGESLWYKDGEFTYNANQDTCANLHHSYTIMPNGNYLILGSKAKRNKFKRGDFIVELNKKVKRDTTIAGGYGTVLEINREGEVIWEYDLATYIKDQNNLSNNKKASNGHLNSVFYDEKEDFILISLRDISRVIKVDRKTKKVIDSYGSEVDYGNPQRTANTFYRQHSAELDQDGNLLLYSNGTGKGADTISSVQLLSIPTGSSNIQKIWEYNCNFGPKEQSFSVAKGDVDIINDNEYLVSMGTIPRTFIVNKNKEIQWECLHQAFRKPQLKGVSGSNPSQKELEEMRKRTKELAKAKPSWLTLKYNYSVNYIEGLYPNYYTCELVPLKGKHAIKINNGGEHSNIISWRLEKEKTLITEGSIKLKANNTKTIDLQENLEKGLYAITLKGIYDKNTEKKYYFNVL